MHMHDVASAISSLSGSSSVVTQARRGGGGGGGGEGGREWGEGQWE